MKVLIIEDEKPAAERLSKLVASLRDDMEIADVIDSVDSAVVWLREFGMPGLIFMDIQLADGLCFDIFRKVKVRTPVIFTTAFDQYALRAFEVNSIDYLLKPIDIDALKRALEKYNDLRTIFPLLPEDTVSMLQQALQSPRYRERFLVKQGSALQYIPVRNIAYFYAEEGVNFIRHKEGDRCIIDLNLEEIERRINPRDFFRVNRKMIVCVESIRTIENYFNGRLILSLGPKFGASVVVSRERVMDFKEWLGK
ncbi:LytR/AlgR family response regulator transcription factor [Sinomicrobium sp. M5D2P17]